MKSLISAEHKEDVNGWELWSFSYYIKQGLLSNNASSGVINYLQHVI